jgi:sulfur transfer complex TusBCD TusB component (DsrH family)
MMVASCSKDDSAPVAIADITLNKTDLTLAATEIDTLTATVTPEKVADKTLAWTSSNQSVATVSNGVITAVASGNTVITVTAANGKTASCNLKVHDVYVAGYIAPGLDEPRIARLWKNGVAVDLPLPEGTTTSDATCVYVSGNDVYVTGRASSIGENDFGIAMLWKNGVARDLSADAPVAWYASSAYSVYVENNDVYVAIQNNGEENYINTASIWKNGTVTDITDGVRDAHPRSLYVSNGNTYVAGWEWKENYTYLAKLWKNGEETALADNHSFAYSIYVSGNDVYVAGYDASGDVHKAKLWKNGVATVLNSGFGYSEASSVFVSGNDVYVAGEEEDANGNNLARLWKNGVATSLGDGSRPAGAMSVYVLDSNVYVLGVEINANDRIVGKIWKNGKEITTISDEANDVYAMSIFIK